MKAYHPIGTISHATLRTEDLLDSFADALETAIATVEWPDGGHEIGYREVIMNGFIQGIREARMLSALLKLDSEEWQNAASEMVNETLIDALDSFAPPYCCFGAHEGDGSDFGFWPMYDDETLAEARESGYRVDVSVHGNVVLYDAKDQEVWSIV
tara:strand:- start:6035 stop:6499 length:465 start_codon:yes stop_codon:yes gene_type:complete